MTKTKIQIAQEDLAALNYQVSVAQDKVTNANALCRRISWVDQECVKRLSLELHTEKQRATSKEKEVKNLKLDGDAQSLFDESSLVDKVAEGLKSKGYSSEEISQSITRLDLVTKAAEAARQAELDKAADAQRLKEEAELADKIAAEAKAKADREADLDSEIKSLDSDSVLFVQDQLQAKGFSLDEINARLEVLGISDGTSLLEETPITQTCGPEITLPEDENVKVSVGGEIEQPIGHHHHN